MNKSITYKGMTAERLSRKNFSIYLPAPLLIRLNELNEYAEKSSSLAIGRSFIVQFALEQLMRNENVKDLIVERKIDSLRARIDA